MKKIINFMLCVAIILALFTIVVCATQSEETSEQMVVEEFDLKTYLEEKIIPVVVGVLTAIAGLIASLTAIVKALNGLKDTKSMLANEAKQREQNFQENSLALQTKADELKKIVEDVPKLLGETEQLQVELNRLQKVTMSMVEILAIGLSANENIVKSGNGKKINLLLEKVRDGDGGDYEEA